VPVQSFVPIRRLHRRGQNQPIIRRQHIPPESATTNGKMNDRCGTNPSVRQTVHTNHCHRLSVCGRRLVRIANERLYLCLTSSTGNELYIDV